MTLLGDLKHGRTVHSLAHLLAHLSHPPKLRLVSPAALAMPEAICEELVKSGVTVTYAVPSHRLPYEPKLETRTNAICTETIERHQSQRKLSTE